MANSAAAFSASFDPDNNQLVEAEDIVRVLAKVASENITYQKKVDGRGSQSALRAHH